MNRLFAMFSLLLLAVSYARGDEVPNLLPVEQAFVVEARAVDHTTVEFDFKIAKDYYLYRKQIKTKAITAGLTLNALDLPAGEQKHDEFLGDVEVYHQGFVATQHLS